MATKLWVRQGRELGLQIVGPFPLALKRWIAVYGLSLYLTYGYSLFDMKLEAYGLSFFFFWLTEAYGLSDGKVDAHFA